MLRVYARPSFGSKTFVGLDVSNFVSGIVSGIVSGVRFRFCRD